MTNTKSQTKKVPNHKHQGPNKDQIANQTSSKSQAPNNKQGPHGETANSKRGRNGKIALME
jgi:hypothetical protein